MDLVPPLESPPRRPPGEQATRAVAGAGQTAAATAVATRELARYRHHTRIDPAGIPADRARTGAVVRRLGDRTVRRAEPGPTGPLVLEVHRVHDGTEVAVWGPSGTPPGAIESGVDAAVDWAGLRDDPSPLAEIADDDRRVAALLGPVGWVRLGRLPRVGEAVGRAVLAQLVQAVEAARSISQLARVAGTPAPQELWAWPTAAQVGRTPAWSMRRCGISRRGARALHAAALEDHPLERAVGTCPRPETWAHLDARLRSLPGIGVWTSAEVRGALGDPDAVSIGDYNLPGLIVHVLGDGHQDTTDEAMLALLAPFAGQRGRVVRLVLRAVACRVVAPPRRRAPRAALSAHRYW